MKILFADDHALVREGIKQFLYELDEDVKISETSNLKQTIEKAKNKNYDLALIDLKMPDMKGFDDLKEIVKILGNCPVIILSGYHKKEYVETAFESGASGYIPKTLSGKSLISAIRLVLSGEKYIPSSVFFDDENNKNQENIFNVENEKLSEKINLLSKREKNVIPELIKGKTNKEIANKLGVQEITIKIHLRNIYKKLGVNNRVQATRLFLSP